MYFLAESDKASFFLPPQASDLGRDVDVAWHLVLITTTIFFFIVVGAMCFFLLKYRRRTPNDKTSEITHNTPLEIVWTIVPLILVVLFFFIGFKGFINYDTPPSNAVHIAAEARAWDFTFTYPNGGVSRELFLLEGTSVVMDMTSKDYLHALYIPAFRVQRNFVPGRMTHLWFTPTQPSPEGGSDPNEKGFPLFCTQYCGNGHSRMFSFAHVYPNNPGGIAAYNDKLAELANPFKKKDDAGKTHWVPYVQVGKDLASNTFGCTSCHTGTDTGIGPPWEGLWKRDHQFHFSNESGFSLSAVDKDDKWEKYLLESIEHPEAKLVEYKGKKYSGMPSFSGQIGGEPGTITYEKFRALEDYIKSIGNTKWQPDISPEKNPDLYDADKTKLYDPLDKDHTTPVHPESLAGIRARQAQNGAAPQPGNGK